MITIIKGTVYILRKCNQLSKKEKQFLTKHIFQMRPGYGFLQMAIIGDIGKSFDNSKRAGVSKNANTLGRSILKTEAPYGYIRHR